MINSVLLGVLGAQEVIFIALLILLLFGGKRIPELMKGLGKGVREYNNAVNNFKSKIDDIQNDITSSDNTKKSDQNSNNPDKCDEG